MSTPLLLLFMISTISCFSCKDRHEFKYAIKDFRKPLQPQLTEILSKGFAQSNSSFNNIVTDAELRRLSYSEHPMLRTAALSEILRRKSFNHFDILMNHLDDTTIVAIDGGEFGIWFRTVSDNLLDEATWETQQSKNITIDEVLTHHNYLKSAYLILLEIDPQEKYYRIIKNMAATPIEMQDGYELHFEYIEHALYGLAKFKKQEDVKLIQRRLSENVWRLSYISFRLMKEFPDTSYSTIFHAYHRQQFYRFSGFRRNGFSGTKPDRSNPEDFIQALAAQQNVNSARLLDTILHYLPLNKCMPDKENIIDNLVLEIWKYSCPAYEELRNKIRKKAESLLKNQRSIKLDPIDVIIDTTVQSIRWYN